MFNNSYLKQYQRFEMLQNTHTYFTVCARVGNKNKICKKFSEISVTRTLRLVTGEFTSQWILLVSTPTDCDTAFLIGMDNYVTLFY